MLVGVVNFGRFICTQTTALAVTEPSPSRHRSIRRLCFRVENIIAVIFAMASGRPSPSSPIGGLDVQLHCSGVSDLTAVILRYVGFFSEISAFPFAVFICSISMLMEMQLMKDFKPDNRQYSGVQLLG